MDSLAEQLFPDFRPTPRVHVTGISKYTTCERGIDYNTALVGTYRLVKVDGRASVVVSPSTFADTPNKAQIEYLASIFAFTCRHCGARGLFPEATIHGALEHNDIYLMMSYKAPGEVLPSIAVLEVNM